MRGAGRHQSSGFSVIGSSDHRAREGRRRRYIATYRRSHSGSVGVAVCRPVEMTACVGREVGKLYQIPNQQPPQPRSTATVSTHQVNHRLVSKRVNPADQQYSIFPTYPIPSQIKSNDTPQDTRTSAAPVFQ